VARFEGSAGSKVSFVQHVCAAWSSSLRRAAWQKTLLLPQRLSSSRRFARLQDGHLRLTPEITAALLAMVDALRRMLQAIGAHGTDGSNDYKELIEHLKILEDGGTAAASAV
jgi:chemotaxis protein histidine kinase CheA